MRQRLALLAMLFLPPDPGTIFTLARSTNTNIVWVSPTSKTTYASGDTIVGKWKASKALVSPSVSLCLAESDASNGKRASGEDACGKALWPDIVKNGDQYSFSLATPELDNNTAISAFYLKLTDDFAHVEKSPKFNVNVSSVSRSYSASSGLEAESGDVPTDNTVQPSGDPLSTESAIDSSASASSTPEAVAVEANDDPAASNTQKAVSTKSSKFHDPSNIPPDATAQAGFMTSVASGSTGTSGIITTTISIQNLAPGQLSTNNHASISAVAVAIPLSLVAVTLVASILMCFVHRRSIASQRQKNVDLLATSGNMMHSTSVEPHAGPSDVEKAIDALYSYEQAPLPPEGRAIYVPIQAKQPIARPDARRDRLYMPYNSRASTPGTCVDRPSYISEYQPCARTLSDEKRSFVVENTYDMDDSATEAVLSEYLSTPSHMFRSESNNSVDSRSLQQPPQSHSRGSAPEPHYGYGDRERDVYDAVSRAVSQSRSHISYNNFRY